MQVEEEDMTSETDSSTLSTHNQPLVVQGLRSNTADQESHILLFDTEALIVLMLCEEFGISSAEYNNNASQKAKGDVERKFTGTSCQIEMLVSSNTHSSNENWNNGLKNYAVEAAGVSCMHSSLLRSRTLEALVVLSFISALVP